ncbi:MULTISPECIES: glucose-6-phosphate isomerase [Rhodomicrobium]|uniref:glucose-6-phosphate isomerase n=1 Tax=Rhodomicrobium TaxID=1068 RepID=UPI000B4AB93E|nr:MULTISPECIES: glucose-6-phosphate isomerase [Rhodomicrobium]
MTITHRIDGCLDSAIGALGLGEDELARWTDTLGPRLDELKRQAREKSLGPLAVLSDEADLAEAEAAYDRLVEGARVLVIFGTGGSSLGGQALAQLGGWFIPGDDRIGKGRRPRLRFYDNLDALSLAKGLEILDPDTTRYVVISKSGNTAETLSQTLTVMGRLREQGREADIPRLFLGITEPERPGVTNGLRALFTALGVPMLPHRSDIGGRFSVFSNVGMIPAFARGLDFNAFRAGGQAVLEALEAAAEPADFPPALGAALAAGFAKERGVNISVLMPYADRLARFSDWYVQLWAESLGKNDSEGTTPVAALGPVDQHSQLQLYLGGAQDHLTTIIRLAALPEEDTAPMPADLAALAGADYLGGRTVGELVMAQTKAITDAFVAHKRPVRIIELPRLDEWSLGWLMMHFMLETILAAELLGADPFDQPAVELGKRLTKERLAAMAVGDSNADTPATASAHQPDRGG